MTIHDAAASLLPVVVNSSFLYSGKFQPATLYRWCTGRNDFMLHSSLNTRTSCSEREHHHL